MTTTSLIKQNRQVKTPKVGVLNMPGNAGDDDLDANGKRGPVSTPVPEPDNPPAVYNPPSHPYNDSFANPATSEANSKLKSSCQKYMVIGQCEHEDLTLVKVLFCGQEWCPTCGENWSAVHQRKFSRLLPKAMQLSTMGYWVVEWPDKYRHDKRRVYSKNGLRSTTNTIVEVMAGRRVGRKGRVGGYFRRAILRWHYFGDKRPGKYNPHLNIITESGLIDDGQLEEIKAKLRESLNCPDLIVHYEYTTDVHKMIHLLKYITRATFLNRSWDKYMASQLYGFRNIRWWGSWTGGPVWGAEGQEYYLSIAKMESGVCIKCGGHVTWSKPINSHPLDSWTREGRAVPLGGGYFEVDVGQYAGDLRGVDPVEVVDGRTGELVPVEDSVYRRMVLRGVYDDLKYQNILLEAIRDDKTRVLDPLGLKPSREWIRARKAYHIAKIKESMGGVT